MEYCRFIKNLTVHIIIYITHMKKITAISKRNIPINLQRTKSITTLLLFKKLFHLNIRNNKKILSQFPLNADFQILKLCSVFQP